MNKADDYIDLIDLVETSGESLIYLGDVREAIKQAQRDAIEATLKLAAKKARVIRDSSERRADDLGHARRFRIVDPVSILSLKDELLKQINE